MGGTPALAKLGTGTYIYTYFLYIFFHSLIQLQIWTIRHIIISYIVVICYKTWERSSFTGCGSATSSLLLGGGAPTRRPGTASLPPQRMRRSRLAMPLEPVRKETMMSYIYNNH